MSVEAAEVQPQQQVVGGARPVVVEAWLRAAARRARRRRRAAGSAPGGGEKGWCWGCWGCWGCGGRDEVVVVVADRRYGTWRWTGWPLVRVEAWDELTRWLGATACGNVVFAAADGDGDGDDVDGDDSSGTGTGSVERGVAEVIQCDAMRASGRPKTRARVAVEAESRTVCEVRAGEMGACMICGLKVSGDAGRTGDESPADGGGAGRALAAEAAVRRVETARPTGGCGCGACCGGVEVGTVDGVCFSILEEFF